MEIKKLGIGSRVHHPVYGEGVVCGDKADRYKISFPGRGVVEIAKSFDKMEVIESVDHEPDMVSIYDIEDRLEAILRKWLGIQEIVPMGDRWKGGKMILQPGNPELKSKEIPIETFFHKIVMLRDRLRVLEQNINSHKVLTDEEKVHLQQYITRIYGTLTTFNILFKYSTDHFKGEGKSKE